MKKRKSPKGERSDNPYQPPKTNPERDYDRWLETVKHREDTDWTGFCFVMLIFITVLLQPLLINFLIEIFKKL